MKTSPQYSIVFEAAMEGAQGTEATLPIMWQFEDQCASWAKKCYFGWPMEGLDHYDGSALEGYFLCTYGRAEFIAAVALWSVISGCQWKGKIAYGCNILDSYFRVP